MAQPQQMNPMVQMALQKMLAGGQQGPQQGMPMHPPGAPGMPQPGMPPGMHPPMPGMPPQGGMPPGMMPGQGPMPQQTPPGMPPQELNPSVMRGLASQMDSLVQNMANTAQTYLAIAAQTGNLDEKAQIVADIQQRLVRLMAGEQTMPLGGTHGVTGSQPQLPPDSPDRGGPPNAMGPHNMMAAPNDTMGNQEVL